MANGNHSNDILYIFCLLIYVKHAHYGHTKMKQIRKRKTIRINRCKYADFALYSFRGKHFFRFKQYLILVYLFAGLNKF